MRTTLAPGQCLCGGTGTLVSYHGATVHAGPCPVCLPDWDHMVESHGARWTADGPVREPNTPTSSGQEGQNEA
jgi:hypothetical protein